MDRKKLVVIVVLVVVIVVAVVIVMKRTSNEPPPAPVVGSAATKVDLIDMKTLEVFSELSTDWQTKYAPDASGHFKNPKTGEYTVVKAMKCASCGQLIPVPETPADQLPPKPTARGLAAKGESIKYGEAMGKARMQLMRGYICPKCGKPAAYRTGSPATTSQ
jgi:predicted RNA-binding Zn-ribbon protein involved in translation (DUF1610 family)